MDESGPAQKVVKEHVQGAAGEFRDAKDVKMRPGIRPL